MLLAEATLCSSTTWVTGTHVLSSPRHLELEEDLVSSQQEDLVSS